MSQPLVTCLCPTRNRRDFLPGAIECFLRQTYLHRELLILHDGEEGIADLVPENDPRIRVMVTGWSLPLGMKRNLGCELAQGEIIAHWDDDDFSAPRRLEAQVTALQSTGSNVTGYRSMKFLDIASGEWWQYTGEPGYVLGTSLCYRKEFWKYSPFPSVASGEDGEFVERARSRYALHDATDLGLMYATIHDRNTSPRQLLEPAYRKLARDFRWQEAAA